MEKEKNFKWEKSENLLNFVTFRECFICEKLVFLKIAAEAFEAGDFLNNFLRFLGFWGSFGYKNIFYEKMCSV